MARVIRERKRVTAKEEDSSDAPIKKKKVIASTDSGTVENVTVDLSDISLPTKRTVPSNNIGDYAFLIFGEEKIGKTSFANQFGETFFFAFERGTKAASVFTTKVLTYWEEVMEYMGKIEKSKNIPYTFYTIDTGHAAYDRALEFVCRRDSIPHPGKVKDYGASWKEVTKEFTQFHSRLANLGGFIVISHERTRERTGRDGVKFDRIEPAFSESTELFYKAICDMTAYYHQASDRKRYLLIQPTDMIHAGHRIDGHFLTPDGDAVVRVPMGNSAEEAFHNFTKAFNNKQTDTYAIVREKGGAVKKRV